MPDAVLDKALATIARHNLLPRGARVIAAVSGGPDSVCLLYTLLDLSPQLGFRVAGVAHFNHQLRGADSDADETFTAALARELGLPFHRASARPPERGNLEQAARRMRREFFAGLLQSVPADRVALGHTRDDQAETVLFRLLRGAGLAGLAGILPVTTGGLVRPLLDVTREEVRAFLRARSIPFREDATNLDPRFSRNRIRHSLLPQLARGWNPRIVEILAHLADLAYEEERWWAGEIARLSAGVVVVSDGAVDLDARAVAAVPRAAARRLVRHAIRLAKGDLARVEWGHVQRVLELAAGPHGDGRAILPGLCATRSFDWIRLAASRDTPAPAPQTVAIPGRCLSPDRKSLIVLEFADAPRARRGYATLGEEVDWRKLPPRLELRGWMPGDHYRPAGYSRDHKLKDLFQRARIPSWRRASWPILCSDSAIVWARNFGPAADFAATAHGSGGRRRLFIREVPAPQ
jgi:tRNA(Ile)-lysidine synthase